MKKKLVTLVLVLALFGAMGIKVVAAEPRATIATPTLTFDGTTANCEVRITDFGKQIVATLELWQGSTLIASWNGTASSRLVISETCTVTKGLTYTLKVNGTVGGVEFEETQVSGKCN